MESTTNGDRSEFLTADELAEILKVGTAHIHALAKAGRIPCLHVGRSRRSRRFELEAVLAALRVEVA